MDPVWSQPVTALKGVGTRRAELFAKLGVSSIGALLRLYPRAYEDWTTVVPIADAPVGQTVCVRATLLQPVKEHRVRAGMTLYKTRVRGGTARLDLTFFNNRFVADALHAGETYLFHGKIEGELFACAMTSPQFAPADRPPGMRPVYRQTEGLPSRAIAAAVEQALALGAVGLQDDPLPDALIRRYRLATQGEALRQIHFPADASALAAARRRLVFEELLTLQLGLLRIGSRQRQGQAPRLTSERTAAFFDRLPFAPTGAQRRATADCIADMRRERPMSRLLQGDVGSGKTAVAAAVIDSAAANGWQCALMAPTEILAEQHARSLSAFFEGTEITVALLTGSVRASQKKQIRAGLADGSITVAVGTHALISEEVTFARLGLVITDEQHRFGVAQRAALAQKGRDPHLLVMSATPIPRTLALMMYGDLDLSVLDEMPPGRQPVATYTVSTALRPRLYRFIRGHLDAGRQAYIVCPLVEESEAGGLTAAESYAEELSRTAFADYRVGLLHGRLKAGEKEQIMRRFQQGEIQLLIATTVIEVGVDVPNAAVMVVENAERFGLSQLHQLRGRVGRGKEASTCVLVSDAQNEEAVRRLRVMCETADGFRIADEDLKLRGPGDFFGARQHGLPELRLADLMTDTAPLREAHKVARDLLEDDPALGREEHRGLREAVEALFDTVGQAGLN